MDAYILIDKFLNGEMSPEEQFYFKQRLRDEPSFKKEFEDQKKMQSALNLLLEDELRAQVKTLGGKKVSKGTKRRNILFFALTLGCMLGLGYLAKIVLWPKTLDPMALVEKSFVPPLKSEVRSGEVQIETGISENFFKAMDLIQTKDFSAASKLLEAELDKSSGKVLERNQWFLALAYLPSQKEKAIDLLNQIKSNPKHLYYKSKKFEELYAALR